MEKLKVAVLEDNPDLLKELKTNIDETNLAKAIVWATSSDEFLEKIKKDPVEALILDIDLNGDSMSGIDVANMLKLPVLFVSGKSRDFIERMEELNLNHDFPVESITKPITMEKLAKILPKFIGRINHLNKAKYVYLDFKQSKRNKIDIDTIAYICADKNHGSDSNNKLIYFTDRKPETLIDFSFSKMEEKGFEANQFMKPHTSYRLNKEKIRCYKNHELDIEVVIDGNLAKEIKKIPVSENYRNDFRKYK